MVRSIIYGGLYWVPVFSETTMAFFLQHTLHVLAKGAASCNGLVGGIEEIGNWSRAMQLFTSLACSQGYLRV